MVFGVFVFFVILDSTCSISIKYVSGLISTNTGFAPRNSTDVAEAKKVTSGTMGPSVQKAIGLGYVPNSLSAIGTEILIQVRNKQLKAKVVKLPFYKAN